MSYQSIRHFVLAAVVASIQLLPATSVQAAVSPPASAPGQAAHAAGVDRSAPGATAPGSNATVASSGLSAARIAQIRDSGPPVMTEAADYVATASLGKFAPTTSTQVAPLATVTNPRLYREVFGFAYASSIGDPTVGYPSWNMSLLSTVAFFGLHVNWNGSLIDDAAMSIWNNPNGPVPGMISAAHTKGTKVVVTIILMDSTAGTPNMCDALEPAYAANTIQQTVAQVAAKHIDGVNVDYESNNTTCKVGNSGATQSSQSMFTAFIKNLRAALPSGSYLSVDTYSGSAGFRSGSTYYGFFDITSLASYVDSFFVMAYDMEYSNWDSAPLNCSRFCLGPTAPLTTYLFNDTRASDEYTAVVSPSKVIMGVPYYGRKECVSGYTPANAPANAAGTSVAADGYLDASTEDGYSANSDYHVHRDSRDAQGAERWDTWTSSTAACTREMYWDDVTSLGNKYDLVINDHLRGIGIWTLSYGGGAPELWDLINLKFGHCSNATIAADETVPQIPGTAVTFSAGALCAGTAQYRFLLTPPGGALSVVQPYGAASTWTWNTTDGMALGTYQIEVDARNLGSTAGYDTWAVYSFRLALCVTPTLSTDVASPELPTTTVTVTATVTCRGTPEFQFALRTPAGSSSVVQPYAAAGSYAWTAPAAGYGTYAFTVAARTAGTTVASESTQTLSFARTSCIGTSLASDKTSPQPTGSQVTLTASATCDGAAQYRFMVQPPGGPAGVAKDFGAPSTFAWSASGAGGAYMLEVDALSAGAPLSADWPAQLAYFLTSCSAGTLAVAPASPQVRGANITLTAGATCPATAEYRFVAHNPDTTTTTLSDFGTSSSFTWSTTGLAYGAYVLEVDVRDAGAVTPYETRATSTFNVSAQPCTVPTLTPDVVSPQGTGATITFTGATTACPSPLYKFWVQTPDATWHVMQDYSASPTFTWTASGAAGAYRVEVDVRDATRPVQYDQYLYIPYTLTACTAATLSADKPSPQTAGATVVFTGGASCPRTPQFRFYMNAGSGWSIVQDYGSSNTFSWRTAAGGNYSIEVDVRDAGATASYETYASAPFTVNAPCATPRLSASPAAGAGTGTTVTLSATTSGCPTPTYRFLVRRGTTWSVARDYSTSSSFGWSTAGLPAGTYGLEVDVRNQASTVGYEAYAIVGSYTLSGCTAARLTTDKASPQPTGTTVTLTSSSSCLGTPEYRFLLGSGTTWTVVQGYSASATLTWSTAALRGGTYGLEVDVRDQGSAAGYEAWTRMSFALAACTGARVTTDKASPQHTGTTVVLTATATCPGVPEYRFLVGGSVVQGYSTANTYTWSTSGAAAGPVNLEVDVRNQGSTVGYEAWGVEAFALTS